MGSECIRYVRTGRSSRRCLHVRSVGRVIMSILGDIIGREWLECELEDAKRELARVTERARESIREEIRRRCAVNDSNDHQEVRFYETHSESIRRSEEMLILALGSPLQQKITFLEHLLS